MCLLFYTYLIIRYGYIAMTEYAMPALNYLLFCASCSLIIKHCSGSQFFLPYFVHSGCGIFCLRMLAQKLIDVLVSGSQQRGSSSALVLIPTEDSKAWSHASDKEVPAILISYTTWCLSASLAPCWQMIITAGQLYRRPNSREVGQNIRAIAETWKRSMSITFNTFKFIMLGKFIARVDHQYATRFTALKRVLLY
jgi:hypothetical protein